LVTLGYKKGSKDFTRDQYFLEKESLKNQRMKRKLLRHLETRLRKIILFILV